MNGEYALARQGIMGGGMIDPLAAPAGPVHPDDEAQLAQYARGAITAREFARRVLRRIGEEVPPSLAGEARRSAVPPEVSWRDPEPLPPPRVPDLTPPEPPVARMPSFTEPGPPPAAETDRPEGRYTSSMAEDTAMIARGELDIAGWLRRAEQRYGQR